MRTQKARTQVVRKADRRPAINEPELREFLDHLGCLLAQEYVRLLSRKGADEFSPRQEEPR